MLLQEEQRVFLSNCFTSPICLLFQWLIKVKKSQPSTLGHVSHFLLLLEDSPEPPWPYCELIETLFRNTKVNISSHVIPISLQWILSNRGRYWVADPMCYLNSQWDTHSQEPGNERGWPEGENRGKLLGTAGASCPYCHKFAPHFQSSSVEFFNSAPALLNVTDVEHFFTLIIFHVIGLCSVQIIPLDKPLLSCLPLPPNLEDKWENTRLKITETVCVYITKNRRQGCAREVVMWIFIFYFFCVSKHGLYQWIFLIREEEKRDSNHWNQLVRMKTSPFAVTCGRHTLSQTRFWHPLQITATTEPLFCIVCDVELSCVRSLFW